MADAKHEDAKHEAESRARTAAVVIEACSFLELARERLLSLEDLTQNLPHVHPQVRTLSHDVEAVIEKCVSLQQSLTSTP